MTQEEYFQHLGQLFKRDDLRAIWPTQMDADSSFIAAQAFVMVIRERLKVQSPGVAVSYDARLGSRELAVAACRGISAAGGKPVLLGMGSTERLYFACGSRADLYTGGIMITASHNPADYNGMKFILRGCEPLNEEAFSQLRRHMAQLWQPVPEVDMEGEFVQAMLKMSHLDGPLPPLSGRPIKAVVAAGNGVGVLSFRGIARELEKAGFEFIYLDGEPDSRFPNGVPNPLLPEYMTRLGEAVIRNGAAIGIGFDGDADRAGVVDSDGREVHPSQIYALIASQKLRHLKDASPTEKPVLMRNICGSRLIDHLFQECATVVETPVGHGQIKRMMRHEDYAGRVIFAGEHSGHYFYPEFFRADSGILTALLLLAQVRELRLQGQTLVELLAPWRKNYHWSGEINWRLESTAVALSKLRSVWSQLQSIPGIQRLEVQPANGPQAARVVVTNAEYQPEALAFPDLKCVVDNGAAGGWWCVLRSSGNEPQLRLNVEAWGPQCEIACASQTARICDWIHR